MEKTSSLLEMQNDLYVQSIAFNYLIEFDRIVIDGVSEPYHF